MAKNGTWIVIAVLALIAVGMFVQNKWDILSVIPADGGASANQQCTFIADINSKYVTEWTCNSLGGADWIAYDINNDGIKEKFGLWSTASQNQGDSCDTRLPGAPEFYIEGVGAVRFKYGKLSGDSYNSLVVCCGLKSYGFAENRGSYASAVTTCPTSVPPTCTSSWVYGAWSECVNGYQTRSAVDYNNCNPSTSTPTTIRTCVSPTACATDKFQCSDGSYVGRNPNNNCQFNDCPIPLCTPNWQTGSWSACVSGFQTRTVNDLNNCNINTNKPSTSQTCTVTCTPNWICTDFGTCSAGTQSRTCSDSNSCGQSNPNSLTQSCTSEEPTVCTATQFTLFNTCFDKTFVWIGVIVLLGLIVFAVVKK